MPEHFSGKLTKVNAHYETEHRRWVEGEVEWVLQQRANGYSIPEIAEASGRTVASVSLKIKRQAKLNGTYNAPNRERKYTTNQLFLDTQKIDSVLDLYAGGSFYLGKGIERVVTNDIDTRFETTHHKDALKLLCEMYSDGERFDLIDLDPYGSPYDCLDLSVKMAQKCLVVSFGEWGHQRWRRYDFVQPRYGISDKESFTVDAFVREVERIGRLNKRSVEVFDVIKYGNFMRAYFILGKIIVTEQWEKE